MKKFFSSLLLLGTSLFFVACEDSGSSTDIVRPLTMDGIVLSSPRGDQFRFVRSFTSGAAETAGSIETGAFFYTSGGTNLQLYPSLTGDNSDVLFPDAVNLATYQYLAVNDTAGVLTLNGQAVNDLTVSGSFNALNGSFVFFFANDSSGNLSTQVDIDITFEGGSTTIDGINTVWSIANSTTPQIDSVVIPATLALDGGGSVPRGFNPEFDFDRASELVPATFTGLVFILTDPTGAAPTVQLQFTADTGVVTVENVDETGTALQRVGAVTPTPGVPTIPGVNYMAERISQTSDVELILDGGGNAQDGTYILSFQGTDAGTVTQTTGSGTLLQGTFQVFDDIVL